MPLVGALRVLVLLAAVVAGADGLARSTRSTGAAAKLARSTRSSGDRVTDRRTTRVLIVPPTRAVAIPLVSTVKAASATPACTPVPALTRTVTVLEVADHGWWGRQEVADNPYGAKVSLQFLFGTACMHGSYS
jgi:hypothetical protein